MQNKLEDLIMNVNPLKELSSSIKYLRRLKVLGIAHTKILELPEAISKCNLKQIVVENTPLKVPKLITAERGFEAIKQYFEDIKNKN